MFWLLTWHLPTENLNTKHILKKRVDRRQRGKSITHSAGMAGNRRKGIAIAEAEKVVSEIVGILKGHPHWHTSDKQARQIQRRLHSLLEQDRVENIPETVEKNNVGDPEKVGMKASDTLE